VKVVAEEGMSFKIKAKLQAEELLKTSWRTIHDQHTPPNVKADLIKATMRWAEYDTPPKDAVSVNGQRSAFQINIQFNNANTQSPTQYVYQIVECGLRDDEREAAS
jgi:hypothetical protein